ncbi:Fc.00g109200.m01.CDS01 [Cosmosporella sp. VM-42]
MSSLLSFHVEALHRAGKVEIDKLAPSHRKRGIPCAAVLQQLDVDCLTIPDPGLLKTLADLNHVELPTIGQCAVHLELLEAFHALRSQVINSLELNEVFGISYGRETPFGLPQSLSVRRDSTDEDRAAKRMSKWTLFLELAAARFLEWALRTNNSIPMVRQWSKTKSTLEIADIELPFLPPIDVLMVWHALLLNPADFERYCQRKGFRSLTRVKFPWQRIHKCIDASTWVYCLPEESRIWVNENAQMEPDLFKFLIKAGRNSSVIKSICTQDDIFAAKVATEKVQAQALVGNVRRQEIFVDKMHAHLWIRSPMVLGTLQRAGTRYENFLELFRLHPRKTLVPTLDIDLVWHTHQLSANDYITSMRTRCGRFINHDDKIGQTTLSDGMTETQELFQVHFGQEYSVCLCWDCEAVTSALEACEDALLNDAEYHDLVERVQKDLQYHRAAELARRAKDLALLKSNAV